MAIYRNIQMAFWTDSKIAESFSTDEKLMYLYLMTNPHTNLCGCYEVSYRLMAFETGFTQQRAKTLIAELTKKKVISYSEETSEVIIPKWYKYNWTASEKFRKPLGEEIDRIKSDAFREFLTGILYSIDTVPEEKKYRIDTVSEANIYPIDTTLYVSVSDTVSDNNKIKHKYGEYNNVLLTDEELEKLKAEFPDWEKRINDLSAYIKSKGAKYVDHLATIRNWARREKEPKKPKTQNRFNNFKQRDYNYAELERQLLGGQACESN